MEYIAILGRQPEFGLVELESQFGAVAIEPFSKQTALLASEPDINQLGGVQKIGQVLYRGPARDVNEAPLNLNELPLGSGKTNFGLSYYDIQVTSKFVAAAGLTLKKRLKTRSSLRLVTPTAGTALSAAQVKFNSLTGKGFELLIAGTRREMVVAITRQVQDIDSYAARDYQRPSRSARVGMLPPKLAQLMVNTTTAPLVFDPFAGTGVVLQEALLLSRQAAGSDLSPKMVAATRDNIRWLADRSDLPAPPSDLVVEADARSIQLPASPVAIVTEGYLGPNFSKPPTPAEVKTLRTELLSLFEASLRSWREQLPRDAEVTIAVPAWQATNDLQTLGLLDRLSDLGYTLKRFRHADTRNLIYRRPQQFVGRQLLILRTT